MCLTYISSWLNIYWNVNIHWNVKSIPINMLYILVSVILQFVFSLFMLFIEDLSVMRQIRENKAPLMSLILVNFCQTITCSERLKHISSNKLNWKIYSLLNQLFCAVIYNTSANLYRHSCCYGYVYMTQYHHQYKGSISSISCTMLIVLKELLTMNDISWW